jgi:hypothetical protein
MTTDQHVRLYIDQLLADFRTGFEPFVITVLKSTHGADWFTVLRNTPDLRTPLDARVLQLDATALVRIILAHWDSTFGRVLSAADRSLLHEIRSVRNRWAHQASIPLDDVDRLADNVIRLLTSIRADHTVNVIAQREAFRVKRYAPHAARNAWRTPAVWIAASIVGLVCTLSLGYAVYATLDRANSAPAEPPQQPVAAELALLTYTPSLPVPIVATLTVNPTFTASDSYPCMPGQIKGNGRTMIFHLPDGMYYSITRNGSVVCFDSIDAALQAGYRGSKR